MPIKTGRCDCVAEVEIDRTKCILCGLCVKVCKGAPLYLNNGKIAIDQDRIFGCVGCGHCVAICPNDAIRVEGRDISLGDIREIPNEGKCATYEQLIALLTSRRSIREFADRPIDDDIIGQILEACSMAPMGIPPSDVEVLVLKDRQKVMEFSTDMIKIIQAKKWLVSPAMLKLYGLFTSKETMESIKSFIVPAVEVFAQGFEGGSDWLLYEAPLAMYFHSSPYSDPVDPLVTATYAMVAAESLGLGSCMIGTISYLLRFSGKRIKQKYGIPLRNQQGIMVIFGYPDVQYKRVIKRRLSNVHYY